MFCYHYQRKRAQIQVVSRAFYYIFVFVIFWLLSRILYLTDTFYNYSFNTMTVLSSMPTIFTYITIAIVIGNVIKMCYCIEDKESARDYNRCVRVVYLIVSSSCILTQIFDLGMLIA